LASIAPAMAYETSTLTASASGWSDVDGDAAGYTYRWFNNGAVIAGQTASTLTGAFFSKGNVIIAEVTPFDGAASGTPRNSSSVTILNSAPLSPSTLDPRQTTDLTPLVSWIGQSDPDGDALRRRHHRDGPHGDALLVFPKADPDA
jgi:hypothetical protein